MQVHVPCPRLAAQWNLGIWHLVRHAEKHPQTGVCGSTTFPMASSAPKPIWFWQRWICSGRIRRPRTGWISGCRCRWIPTPPVITPGQCLTVPMNYLRRARMPHSRSGSAGCRRSHGRRSRVWPRFNRLGSHRTLLADRRPGLAEGRHSPDHGQRPMDAASTAGGVGYGPGQSSAAVGAKDADRPCR